MVGIKYHIGIYAFSYLFVDRCLDVIFKYGG